MQFYCEINILRIRVPDADEHEDKQHGGEENESDLRTGTAYLDNIYLEEKKHWIVQVGFGTKVQNHLAFGVFNKISIGIVICFIIGICTRTSQHPA